MLQGIRLETVNPRRSLNTIFESLRLCNFRFHPASSSNSRTTSDANHSNPHPATMPSPAFVFTAANSLLTTSRSAWTPSTVRASPRPAHVHTRRVRVSMMDEPATASTSTSMPTNNNDSAPKTDATETAKTDSDPMSPPTLDTTVFSDFVDSAQAKLDDLQQQMQDVDVDEVVANTTQAGKGLVDNLLAGDWLNRGELYGALQLVLVVFLLRAPSLIDGVVSLCTGPLLLLFGAVVSGKGVVDLGLKQMSIWPAPVPDASLKTEGVYEIVRHPIYSGLLLASIGFAVATGSPARMAITVGMAVLLVKKIEVEEQFLIDAYPDYSDYVEDVPYKILPKIF